MNNKIPQHIIDKLKEEQSKSRSKKKKVGCVITYGEGILSMGHNVPSYGKSYPMYLSDWLQVLEDRASVFNKEKYAHAEFMAVKALNKDLFKDKLSVYITHKPCEVCAIYLRHHLPNAEIIVVDMDNQPTTDKAETKPKDYYTLQNGIEAKDVLQYFLYNLGAAMKYIWRAGKKDTNSASDLNKAMDYLILEMIRLGIKRKSNLSKELLKEFNNKS